MTEPIAIVGMACRFPGAADPEAFWKLLVNGTEAVREPPRSRPELEPPPWLVEQAPTCRRGGFLEDLDQFEPGFFRISPREAARMDPQQRLLLEIAWEALEDAGQPVARLSGTTTGVFVGLMNADFSRRHSRDLTQIDAHLGPGSSLGIAPNRVSFVLDLHGPSMAIDTLCSSSLVAVHLACQSLLADESAPIAIAGGANVILDRSMDVFYARAGLLSKEGRCRAFDAGAGGIVRGEGVGLVVLKRLSRALANGDRIHAVIRGSAVNQDGRSNGLTSPSRWSQEEVLRTAYRRAGIAPSSVGYVEAHGTGTLIGDPIEAAALGAVLGDGRVTSCALGSVKSNLGHLESAAGIASLLKAVLSLKHQTLVPSLHFDRPNPYARLDERKLHVPTSTQPWPGAPICGVSSFGMGGTNAHVVLAAADTTPMIPRPRTRRALLIPISARTTAALDVLETRAITQLARDAPIDVAHSAGARRDHHDHRRALLALSGAELAPAITGQVVPGRTHKIVFVLPDDVECDRQTADDLAAEEPVFRDAMARSLDQGALPAFQHAAAALWQSIGVVPAEVVHVTRTTTQALAATLGDDNTIFIELSPRPSLVGALRDLLEHAGVPGTVVPGFASRASFLHAVGTLYCAGVEIDWRRLDDPSARFVSLGSYPWQRESCALPTESREPAARDESEPHAAPAEVIVHRWERADVLTEANTTGEWLVLGDGGAELAAALAKRGHRVRTDDLTSATRNVVAFCGAALAPTVQLVQTLASRGTPVRLWLVTRGACVVDDTTAPLAALAGSVTWGFGRVVMNEVPRLHCTTVDLSPGEISGPEVELLLREVLAGRDAEREVAIRGEARFVARLRREHLAAPASRPRLPIDAAYLVTGGLGSLGLAAARRLVERGARTLVLLGRRGVVTDEARPVIDALTSAGTRVIVEAADVADRDALAAVLRRYTLRGVIHAAGVMTPAMITAIAPTGLDASLAAKVDGARNLHELTAGQPLDFFVLYSSIATLLGMPGQGVYAAANAYLDALAAHRRASGLPAVSIAWTVIEGTGMAADAGPKALGQLRDRGISTLPVVRATDLLERLLDADTPAHVGAATVDLERWTAFYPHARASARMAPLGRTASNGVDATSHPAPRGLRSAASLEALLCSIIGTVLHDPAPDPQQPLSTLGLDSLTVIELQEMLRKDLDVELSSDRLLGKTSIRDLVSDILALSGHDRATHRPPALREDARLDPSITFDTSEPRSPAAREILLTGATGFLGAFVLADLLEHSQARIHCLVRAPSADEAMKRLAATLDRYDLPALDLGARVTCIPGDLAKPRLGVDVDALARSIDTIIHSGASVNFVYPYEALEAVNVGGTREILRLAAASRARLHYVSTIGVFPGGPQQREVVLETARSTEPERLALGYMRAKWVAEELVLQARDRGLDVSIYRPGTIAGHSRSGAFNPDDFVCALIKGCVQLGLAPRVDAPINLAPVDYVSQALVRIALGESSGTYHLVGREPVAWNELVAWVRQLGYPLADLPYDEWRAVLIERAVATDNALAPLVPLFVQHETTDWLHLPTYDDTRARGTGVACPPVDAALMRRYVERFVVRGYLPRP